MTWSCADAVRTASFNRFGESPVEDSDLERGHRFGRLVGDKLDFGAPQRPELFVHFHGSFQLVGKSPDHFTHKPMEQWTPIIPLLGKDGVWRNVIEKYMPWN